MNHKQLDCKHEKFDIGYGHAYASGWKGIGGMKFCLDCFHTFEFYDDEELMTSEEIEHNRIKREAFSTFQEVC